MWEKLVQFYECDDFNASFSFFQSTDMIDTNKSLVQADLFSFSIIVMCAFNTTIIKLLLSVFISLQIEDKHRFK